MSFNSYQFAIFFLTLVPAYWLLVHWPRAQNVLLLVASYYFYACWNVRFLALLIASTIVDYACALRIDREQDERRRKWIVSASLAFNIGMLGYFKYCHFFAHSLHDALASAGIAVPKWELDVALPIGISFYTFQSMSYVIDVYRREIKPTRNLVQFAVFVSFFPHLVAGPIMRATTLLTQIRSRRRVHAQQFYDGVYLIYWGLFEKVVVADNLALVVDDLFGRWQTLDGGLTLLATYAFAFQIYGDFAGYTDMARGVGKCLGFELPINFNLPYFSTSPRDFWNRWHISLSHWLRDYLYIPLGGNRQGAWLSTRNVLITMLLGGLWHGAEWTFIVWGLYHGLLLVAGRLLTPWLARVRPDNTFDHACWKGLRMIVTFHFVCLGWLVFRAGSLEQAAGMFAAIVARPGLPPLAVVLPVALAIAALLAVQLALHFTDDVASIGRLPWYLRSVLYTAGFYAIVVAGQFGGQQFLYFQF